MSHLGRLFLLVTRPAFRQTTSAPCFAKRLCFVVVKRTRSSCSSALQLQEESVKQKEFAAKSEKAPKIPAVAAFDPLKDREPMYYHQKMESWTPYQGLVFSKQDLLTILCKDQPDISSIAERQDWNSASEEELVDAFRRLTSHAVKSNQAISMPCIDSIMSTIADRISEFSDGNFMEIGKLYSLYPFLENIQASNHQKFLLKFDENCCFRYKEGWFHARKITQIMQISDIIWWQRQAGTCNFFRFIIYHLSRKLTEHHHMIQLLFYLGALRKVPQSYKFYDMEKKLYSFHKQYSLQELCIAVQSFFRIKATLQYQPLIQDLLMKAIQEVPNLDDNLLITISKGLRRVPRELKTPMRFFQKKLLSRIDDLNFTSSVHALWMFSTNNILDEEFGDAIYKKAFKEISKARMKELTRIMVAFTETESPTRDMRKLAEATAAELKKPEKIGWIRQKRFVQASFLHRLLICGVCPADFLDFYFSGVKSVENHTEALGLDVHLEVFFPEYCGRRLRPDLREAIYKHRFEDSENDYVKSTGKVGRRSTFNKKSVQYAVQVPLDLVEGKDDHFHIGHLVPSSGYLDVVLCVNERGMFLPIPQVMVETKPGQLTRIPNESIDHGCKFFAVMFLDSEGEFQKKQIRTFQKEKKAILEKLGFIPLEISVGYRHRDLSEIKTELQAKISSFLQSPET